MGRRLVSFVEDDAVQERDEGGPCDWFTNVAPILRCGVMQ
jgi:hypothetical protein